MADLELRAAHRRRQKYLNLENPGIHGRLREGDPESEEYARQYALFHYDFYRTQGFGIEWDKFDFFFPYCHPYDGARPLNRDQTNEEVIKEETLRAIAYYNEENGTNIVFVEHIEANFRLSRYFENWITFWAVDMSSRCQEPKIYQAHTQVCGGTCLFPIFRVKPTEEEMAAAPIHVDPPPPYRFDRSKLMLVFDFAGPKDDPVPGTPFIFNRVPHPPLPLPPRPPSEYVIRPPPIPPNWRDLPPWNRQQ